MLVRRSTRVSARIVKSASVIADSEINEVSAEVKVIQRSVSEPAPASSRKRTVVAGKLYHLATFFLTYTEPKSRKRVNTSDDGCDSCSEVILSLCDLESS